MSEYNDLAASGWDFEPDRSTWPAIEDFCLEETAVALLLIAGVLVVLGAHSRFPPDDNPKALFAGLYVRADDVFTWGCSDVEELPAFAWGGEEEKALHDLYELYRVRGWDGAILWLSERRNMLPIFQRFDAARAASRGLKPTPFCERFAALPERDDWPSDWSDRVYRPGETE